MTIATRTVSYEYEGKTFDGFIAVNDKQTEPRPAVMICHAWGGRSEHEEMVARRIAELGYVGFAADIFGVGQRGTTTEECQGLMMPLVENPEELRARLSSALDAMGELDEVDTEQLSVSGYCFGGLCALTMARMNAPVLGVTAFHSIFGTSDPEGKAVKPKILALQGYDDPMADPDAQRQFAEEMTARKADWQLHLYGGVAHAFTNQGANDPTLGLKYNVAADSRSWTTFENFLAELFG